MIFFSNFLQHHMNFAHILLNLAAFNPPLRNFQTPYYSRFSPGFQVCVYMPVMGFVCVICECDVESIYS